jgi:hypothetical protein
MTRGGWVGIDIKRGGGAEEKTNQRKRNFFTNFINHFERKLFAANVIFL